MLEVLVVQMYEKNCPYLRKFDISGFGSYFRGVGVAKSFILICCFILTRLFLIGYNKYIFSFNSMYNKIPNMHK